MATKEKEVEVVEPTEGEMKTVKVTIDPSSLPDYPRVGSLDTPELVSEEVDAADVHESETVKEELVTREVDAEPVKTPEEMKDEADKAIDDKKVLDKDADKQ